jgi:apolipoprotein N-acyltransferase
LMRHKKHRSKFGYLKHLQNVTTGAIASLSLPPFFLLPAIFVLSFPMLAYCQASSRREAMMIFAGVGLGWFFASTYWISHSLIIYSPSLWALRPLMALALSLCLAAFWAMAAILAWSFGRSPIARALWLIVMLGIGEWCRGFVGTGFPWNLPGTLFSATLESLQAASLFGVYGLSVIVLLVAMAPAFWRLGGARFAKLLLLLIPIFYGGGMLRLADGPAFESEMPQVRLVQPAIPQAEKWAASQRSSHLAKFIQLSQYKSVPELVIWPETAFAAFPSREPELLVDVVKQSAATGGQILTGAPRIAVGRGLLNSALLMRQDGTFVESYDKRHLVPFGEYIPFRSMFPFVSAFVSPVDFVPGLENRLLPFAGNRHLQVLICYEVIFSGAVIDPDSRPDLMVNLTNDAWFGDTAGPWQHLYQSQMRAVEEGVPLLRVANTGISAGFDAMGRQLGILPLGTQGVLDVDVPSPLKPTLFARFGNVIFFGLLGLIMMFACCLDVLRAFRQ